MATKGKDLYVLIEDEGTSTIIAGTRTTEIDRSVGMQEVTSPTTADSEEYLPQRSKWSITTGWLMVADDMVLNVLRVGQKVKLHIATRRIRTETPRLTGYAWIQTCRITANTGNLVQGSFQFVGNGELEQYTPPEPEEEEE